VPLLRPGHCCSEFTHRSRPGEYGRRNQSLSRQGQDDSEEGLWPVASQCAADLLIARVDAIECRLEQPYRKSADYSELGQHYARYREYKPDYVIFNRCAKGCVEKDQQGGASATGETTMGRSSRLSTNDLPGKAVP